VVLSQHNHDFISLILFLLDGDSSIQTKYYVDKFFLTPSPILSPVVLIICVLLSAFLLLGQGEGINLHL
uniref:Uncharacterized protein n=1 Tax=Sciurus vulgaris TaxID=55149 RepID=A0A8D2AXY6_SCIVU